MSAPDIRLFYDVNGVLMIGELVNELEDGYAFKNLCVMEKKDDDSNNFEIYGDLFYGMAEGNVVAISDDKILYYAKACVPLANLYMEQIAEWEKHLMQESERRRIRNQLRVVQNEEKNDE